MTYDGDLTIDDMAQILENNDDVTDLPTTEQDAIHTNQDAQFGRHYNEKFDLDKVGKRGTKVLNDPVNDPNQPHGDHFDVVERDPVTDTVYHNRVFDDRL